MKFAADSQRNADNTTNFVGKLKHSKLSVPKSNHRKHNITEQGRSFNERWTNDFFLFQIKTKQPVQYAMK